MLRVSLAFLLTSVLAGAAPRVDNVLARMVPSSATALVGIHMQEIEQTDVFRRLLATGHDSGMDDFARETGFDPRKDVSEILNISGPTGRVVVARGRFHVNAEAMNSTQTIRYGEYTIHARRLSGFCILDGTLAAAGDVSAIEAALTEWKSGTHTGANALLARAAPIDPSAQMWGVMNSVADFVGEHLPSPSIAGSQPLDLSQIFRGMTGNWFEASLKSGLNFEFHSVAATEKDAMNFRDAVRGMVGFGRLNVPEDQPEMLRVFDGITVDQSGRAIVVKTEIASDLVGKLLDLFNQPSRRTLL